jgi:hypothetical protein
MWSATKPSASGYFFDVAVDANENAFVAGYDLPTLQDDFDGVLCKYDSQGNVVWTTRIGDPLERDWAFAIDLDPWGNVLIAGITWGDFGGGTITSQDVMVAKYDPLGQFVWARQYDSTGDPEGGQAIVVDAAGSSYVAGYGQSGLNKWDADGNFQWHATLGPSNFSWYSGDDITIDSAGNIVVTGHVNANFNSARDALVAKFTSNGQRLWSTQIPGTLIEEALGVAVDDQNSVYLAIAASMSAANADSLIIKLDSDGNVVWQTNLALPTHDFAVSLTVRGDELLVAGMVSSDTGPQPYLASLSLDGQLLDFQTLNSISQPFSLAVKGNSAWIAGWNFENPAETNHGWLMRVTIPEPTSLGLLSVLASVVCLRPIPEELARRFTNGA